MGHTEKTVLPATLVSVLATGGARARALSTAVTFPDVARGGPGGDHPRGGESDNAANDPYGSEEEIRGGAGADTIFGSGYPFGDDTTKATQREPETVSCGAGRDRAYAGTALDTVAGDRGAAERAAGGRQPRQESRPERDHRPGRPGQRLC